MGALGNIYIYDLLSLGAYKGAVQDFLDINIIIHDMVIFFASMNFLHFSWSRFTYSILVKLFTN